MGVWSHKTPERLLRFFWGVKEKIEYVEVRIFSLHPLLNRSGIDVQIIKDFKEKQEFDTYLLSKGG